ncbi:MAG: DUF445 family protein [Tissierellia bacterium]|nr:DUF445 family protein [Tissierellia bacterium]
MNDIIYNYIIQTILGAASGYITNDYAIKMLFKEYTPLKIGGVIKKTRNEFIDNLSTLVESDLINKDKLNEILKDADFKTKLETITKDFYTKYLYEVSFNQIIANIDGFDASVKLTGEYIDTILNNHIEEITTYITENFKLDDQLTEKQKTKISVSLTDSILKSINNTDIINRLSDLLYLEKGHLRINDIINISEDKIVIITNNFFNIFHEIISNDLNKEIDTLIHEIINSFISNDSLVETFYDMSLKDILKIDHKFKNDAAELLISYVNSSICQNMIYEMCESLFSYLKTINKPLYDFTDTNFEINLKSFFLYALPDLTDYLIEWVDFNSENINNLIEDSINEVINESDKMKSMLLNKLKNTYFNNLGEKFNVVEKVKLFIEQETEPDKLSEKISNEIIKYLKNAYIYEIITSVESKDILTPKKLTNNITKYIDTNCNRIVEILINYISEQKVRDILPHNKSLMDTVNNKLFEFLKNKILLSENINLILNEKTNKYIIDLTEKSINEFDPNKTNVFLTQYLNRNKINIENLIKSINIKEINFKNENLSNLISKKLRNSYFETGNKVKNQKLSLVINKINSIKNLYENSSEAIRNFVINNMDYWISGSVKAIVFENLNKLNDDELVDFANDFIGRELQPIMYFGGILGALAGLILAFIQNAPTDFGLFTIGNMITYALVGFITNVIAINMIFKPYKEIKWLSKIPFLRNFSLGYIVKNQQVFAENTSHFVNNTLLRKESINELFSKYEETIKSTLYSNIEKNDFSLFQRLLNNNLIKIISNSSKFTIDFAKKNKKNISHYLFNLLKATKISTLINNNFKFKIINFAKNNILKCNKKFSKYAISKLKSNDLLINQLSINSIDSAKLYSTKHMEKYYDNINNKIDFNNLKSKLIRYEDKYINYINKPINEIFSQHHIDNASSLLSKKIVEYILSLNSKEKTLILLESRLNKIIDKNKNVDEIYNGKVKMIISSNLHILVNQITNSFKAIIINNKVVVSLKIQSEIKNKLGILEKGMYNMLGGGEIVDNILTKLMVVKIPQFIDEKKHEIHTVLSGTIAESLYKLKSKSLFENINIMQINEIINDYFSNPKNQNLIENGIYESVDSLKNRIKNVNLREILNILSLGDLNTMFNVYEDELDQIITLLSSNMTENKEQIIGKIKAILNDTIDKFINNASFNDLFKDISIADIEKSIDKLFIILNQDDFINKLLSEALNSYTEYMREISIAEFINEDEFITTSEKFLDKILLKHDTEELIKKIFTSVFNESIDNNLNFIDKNTKSYFANLFIESSVKSLKENLNYILKSVEFDKLAKEEIESMDARKIHELFNSFCGKYFKRLMIYGLGGFVFGINIYVGLSLTALKIINEKFQK